MGFSEVFGFSIASIDMNYTPTDSCNNAGESAKNYFEIINQLQRNFHFLGVKGEGSQALFSLFRKLINFLSKGIPRLRQVGKYNFTLFGVLELTG